MLNLPNAGELVALGIGLTLRWNVAMMFLGKDDDARRGGIERRSMGRS
ncbi:MAG: hypothetical protein QHC67_01055 [Sphingobium sp.]|nr:hypothetical protein [Sphingobium sp.]MDX3908396.1 hypothetical protein [Sphingobium sp.]